MPAVKSRREMYSEATREALLTEATRLFGQHGFAAVSLDQIAEAALVTRGAVYHHFAGKKALLESVLERLGTEVMQRVTAVVARESDPLAAVRAGLTAFLTESSDPIFGRLVWQEGPIALGWEDWRRCEHERSYAFVHTMVAALMQTGYLAGRAEATTVRIFFELLAGAGLALAEAEPEDRERVRSECLDLLDRMLTGLIAVDSRAQGGPESAEPGAQARPAAD